MLEAWEDAKRKGIDLMTMLATASATPKTSPALSDVLEELAQTKEKSGKSSRYIDQLRIAIGMFAKGRERFPIGGIAFQDIERFLDSKQIRSRPTLRARLSTLFNFSVRRGYRVDNPCDRLETITLEHIAPAVLTVTETRTVLDWLKLNPRSLAWFILSTFVGLRPEEAEKTAWSAISFKEGWIRVEAQTSKIRQRRVVYPMPMAMIWLKQAKKLKAKLPLAPWARRLDRIALTEVLGWSEWKQDVTRHTCASMWLADCGSAATVATALGHSEGTLRKNYMALVTKADAAKFWGL